MNPGDREQEIRRILVAVDASPQSLAALEMAGDLAARFQADLIGIYVEDINLLRVAEFHFAREVGYYSANLHPFDSPLIELQLRARARSVQRAMENLGKRANLRWSFRTARGFIPVELLAAALEVDLIILGKSGWSGRRRIGSTARVLVLESQRQTLILQRRVRLGTPVVVAYDGSTAAKKALAAARLVWSEGINFIVLLLAKEPEQAERLKAEASQYLEENEIEARFSWQPNLDAARIARFTQLEGCGILVLPATSEKISNEAVITVLGETDCAVLLAR
jgi:nucleotide-binding universal stress UspA family protein